MERPDPHEQGAPLAPPTSSSPAKYVPQFSAATEMILKRIQAGATPVGGGLSDMGLSGKPAGYEDMKKTVLQGMKTTYNMEITPLAKLKSATPDRRHDSPRRRSANTGNQASGGRGRGSARKGSRAGVKRKRGMRGSDESDVDESDISGLSDDSDDDGSGEEVVPTLPKTTQSGRQVVRPTQYVPAIVDGPPKKKGTKNSQEQTLCKNCARGHSPQGNQIVFCDGCNLGWHQHCHEPFIMDEVLKDEESPWFCTACNNKAGVKMTPRLDVLALTSGASQTPEQVRASSCSVSDLLTR